MNGNGSQRGPALVVGIVLGGVLASGIWLGKAYWPVLDDKSASKPTAEKSPPPPSASEVAKVIERQAGLGRMNQPLGLQCLSVQMNYPRPEVLGLPGIAQGPYPGSFGLTMLHDVGLRTQGQRDQQLAQLNYLAAQGLLQSESLSLQTDAGIRAATRYTLTWAGFGAQRQWYGNRPCFLIGQRRFAAVDSVRPLPDRVLDHPVFAVTYQTEMSSIPAWVSSPKATELFPSLSKQLGPRSGQAALMQTGDGWQSLTEVERSIRQIKYQSTRRRISSPKPVAVVPDNDPTDTEIQQMLAAAQHQVRSSRMNADVACLPLALRGVGKTLRSGYSYGRQTNSQTQGSNDYQVDFMDDGTGSNRRSPRLITALNTLEALKRAGLAEMSPVDDPETGSGAIPNPAIEPTVRGVRFTIPAAVARILGLNNYYPDCIPAGKFKLSVLGHYRERQLIRVLAKGEVENPPKWVVKLSAYLPALKSMLDNGVAMTAQLYYSSGQPGVSNGTEAVPSGGHWMLRGGIQVHYPRARYETVPDELVDLLPQMTAAYPKRLVAAPPQFQD